MNKIFKKVTRNKLTIPLTPFYRQYPFNSKVSVSSADWRGCVDFELGFFCNRIPKAANSTVVTTLARMKFGREIPSKEAKKIFKNPSELTRAEVAKLPFLVKVAVVRNPYTRTLSAYLDKIERRALRDNRETSFREFLYSLKAGKLYSNGHWAPQSSLLLLPPEDFDFIGKVESLSMDLPVIEEKIQGTPPRERFKSFLRNATGANTKLSCYYDAETADIVKLLYQDDFKLFNYPDTLPLN